MVPKLMGELKERFAGRPGGYTRVLKCGYRAQDKAPLAYIEYVDNSLPPLKLSKQEFGTQGHRPTARASPPHTLAGHAPWPGPVQRTSKSG